MEGQRITSRIFAMALCLSFGCSAERPPEPVQPNDETAELRKRVIQVEADLLEAQKQVLREQEKSEDFRRRLGEIESRFELAFPAATPAATQAAGSVEPTTPARRGGFTDFSSLTPPPMPQPTSAPQQRRPSTTPPPQAPSAPITSDEGIIRACNQKWGTDYRMVAYCQQQQQEAKETLARGVEPYPGFNLSIFAGIQRACLEKWGNDYRMRVYCESEQVKAYHAANRR